MDSTTTFALTVLGTMCLCLGMYEPYMAVLYPRAEHFTTGKVAEEKESAADGKESQRRFDDLCPQLQSCGISEMSDESVAASLAERYAGLRRQWFAELQSLQRSQFTQELSVGQT